MLTSGHSASVSTGRVTSSRRNAVYDSGTFAARQAFMASPITSWAYWRPVLFPNPLTSSSPQSCVGLPERGSTSRLSP